MVITPKPSILIKGLCREKLTDENSYYFHNIIFKQFTFKYEIIFGGHGSLFLTMKMKTVEFRVQA